LVPFHYSLFLNAQPGDWLSPFTSHAGCPQRYFLE
jgi:hypothetical protein